MALHQIDVSEEQNAFLLEQVAGGGYRCASEVVGAALELLKQVSAQEKLRVLRAAIDQGDATKIAEDGVFDRIRHSIEDRAAA